MIQAIPKSSNTWFYNYYKYNTSITNYFDRNFSENWLCLMPCCKDYSQQNFNLFGIKIDSYLKNLMHQCLDFYLKRWCFGSHFCNAWFQSENFIVNFMVSLKSYYDFNIRNKILYLWIYIYIRYISLPLTQ